MIPSDFNGLTPPPAGAPNVFSVFTDDAFGDTADALRLFDFHADFAVPANSTFLERPESPLAVASFDSRNPTSGRADIEEPAPAGAADYLDSIGDRLMLRLQYFNRGGTETLTSCQTVNGGTIPAPGVLPTRRGISRGATLLYLAENQPRRVVVGAGSRDFLTRFDRTLDGQYSGRQCRKSGRGLLDLEHQRLSFDCLRRKALN